MREQVTNIMVRVSLRELTPKQGLWLKTLVGVGGLGVLLQVLDENPEGCEGPWLTYARMVTLRTNKCLTGLDLGIPSLTFQVGAAHGMPVGVTHSQAR